MLLFIIIGCIGLFLEMAGGLFWGKDPSDWLK
jgi:hypothetical protein